MLGGPEACSPGEKMVPCVPKYVISNLKTNNFKDNKLTTTS